MHVAVLSQHTGALMASECFDVFQSRENNRLMARFLRGISCPGRIVAFAVCDEGSHNVDDVLRSVLLFCFITSQCQEIYHTIIHKR